MTVEELKAISKISIDVIAGLDKPYTWVQSFVTDDSIYCIHIAESEEAIREHAKRGKLPVNVIEEIKTVIDPSTAE